MKLAMPKMAPGGATKTMPRSSKPYLRMGKVHLGGKSAFPQGAAAFGPPTEGPPGGNPAFPAGDGGDGAAPGDTGE